MTTGIYPRKTVETRFWEKVNILDNGCWEWIGAKYPGGYGCFWYNGRRMRAHRFMYEQLFGAIPEGLEPDHLCRRPQCVNPFHLEVVTRQVNVLRGRSPEVARQMQLSKTHCPRGHPYDNVNTYFDKNGGRDCRACRTNAVRKWRAKCKAV